MIFYLANAERYLKHISDNIFTIKGGTFTFWQKIIKISIVANPLRNSHKCLYLSKLDIFMQVSGFQHNFKVPFQTIAYKTKRELKLNSFSIN